MRYRIFNRRRKKRFAKKRKAIGRLLFFTVLAIGLGGLISATMSMYQYLSKSIAASLQTQGGKALIVGLFCVALFWLYRRVQRLRREGEQMADKFQAEKQSDWNRQKRIESLRPSLNRSDYVIANSDYRRGNAKENFYRKTFLLRLFDIFQNRCAKCGDKENGMDLDHFLFSKNEGGSFIMQHKEGHFINNAIPLCMSCNRRKSDRRFDHFFTDQQLIPILEKNLLMTKLLNEETVFTETGKPMKVEKTA